MEVIAKIAHLRNAEYNNRMRPLLQTVGEQHAKLMGGKMSRAILALISMCDASGETGALIDTGMQSDDDELEDETTRFTRRRMRRLRNYMTDAAEGGGAHGGCSG